MTDRKNDNDVEDGRSYHVENRFGGFSHEVAAEASTNCDKDSSADPATAEDPRTHAAHPANQTS